VEKSIRGVRKSSLEGGLALVKKVRGLVGKMSFKRGERKTTPWKASFRRNPSCWVGQRVSREGIHKDGRGPGEIKYRVLREKGSYCGDKT